MSMPNDGSERDAKRPAQGLLRPGRFLWARALPWSFVLGIALWIAYKFVKGVGIDLGLDGSGAPTTVGVLAAVALYVLSVLLIERRTPNELGLVQLAPQLAAGALLGAALFSAMMAVLLITGVYALTGPTAAAPWQALTDSLEGVVEELIFRGGDFPRVLEGLGSMVGARPLLRAIRRDAPG
jgi:uncharacterized protein